MSKTYSEYVRNKSSSTSSRSYTDYIKEYGHSTEPQPSESGVFKKDEEEQAAQRRESNKNTPSAPSQINVAQRVAGKNKTAEPSGGIADSLRNSERSYKSFDEKTVPSNRGSNYAKENNLKMVEEIPTYESSKYDTDKSNDYDWEEALNYVPAHKQTSTEKAYEFAKEHPVVATWMQANMSLPSMVGSGAGMLYEMLKKNVAETYKRDPIIDKVFEATNKAYLNMGNKMDSDAITGISKTAEKIRHGLSDYEGINVDNSLFAVSDIKTAMQQGVTDRYDLNALGKDWFDLAYSSGMSMVDSVAAQVVNELVPGGGAALLGMSAATQTLRDSKNKGLTDEQALNNAIVAGAAEIVFESVSLGNFKALQEVSPTGIKDIVVNVLKSSGVNASEELLTEVTNVIYDLVANGDKSDYNLAVQQYIESDVSPEEAKKLARNDIINQIVDATIGGFISGVGFGGVGSVGGYISNSSTQKAVGSQVKTDDDVTAYVDMGLQAQKGSDANKYAKAIDEAIEKGKTPKDSEIGRLAIAVEQYIAENQNVNDIKGKGAFAKIESADELEQSYVSNRNNMGIGTSKDIRAAKRDYKATRKSIEKSDYARVRSMYDTALKYAEKKETDRREKAENVPKLTAEEKINITKPTLGYKNGKVVSVSDITDIKNGQIFVKTSDGKTQALKYADIENAQARKVWQTAAKNFTDPKAAKAFIDNYNGEVVTEYTKAFNDYYQLASTGLSLERIEDMGIAQGNISLAAKVAAVDAGAMSVSFRKGVVDQTTTKKTKMQSLQMRMLDSFGKKYGLNITFVDTLGDYNGFYKPGTNQIVVGLDASEGAVTRTVGHEVYHYIKDANKEGAQKIEDFVLKSLKKLKGEEWVQNKLDSYDKSVYKTEQERIDELVADSMFDVFTNENTVQEFVKQDRSLAQRVLDRVKTLIADIRNIYNKLIAQGSDEIAALRNELETLEKIRDLFFEALDETAPAVNQEQKNTAEAVSKVLLSIKNFTLTESDINKNMLLVGSMENVAELTGNEFKKSSIELPDQVDAFFKKFNYSIENPDIGDVEVTRRGAKDSIGHGIGRIKAVSFAAVPYTIEKGKIIDYQNNWKNRQYDTIVLAAPISINGERYYQGVIVMRETSTQRFYLHEVLTEKESDTSFKTGTGVKHTPGDVSPSLISLLQKVKDVNNNSMQKGSENTPVKFSTKSNNPIREEVSDYINNRSDMQAIYKTIDKLYRLAGKTRLNEKSIESFSNKILSQTHSKYSKELLTERLTALFEFMANSRDFSWDDIMQITAEISKDVLSQSSRLDTSMREEFSDTLKWLKGIDKVYISPEVRAEIDATFGSLDSFRRQIGSRMKITVTDSNAISLDSVWSQLAGDYPGVFDSEITPLDQPAALADFFEMTKPTYQNPYEMDMDEAAYDYALRIYDQYFDIPEVKTEAQKHQLAMDRLRGEFNKKLDALRNEYKAREQAIRREGKLEADNRVAREKLLNRQRQEAYREKRFETELRQKYRAQILRKLNGITKKLVRPTDSEHIPQELIKSINDFAKTLVGSGAFTSQKADNLKRAFDAIGEAAQNPNFNLASMYDEDIADKLENLKKILDGKRFPELTSGELKKVREITDYFAHIVKMSNEAFSESIKERISDLQSDAMKSAKEVESGRKRMGTALQKGLLKPVTFFELLENPTLEKLYTVIRNGEGDWYRVVNKSKNFLQEIKKEYNFKNWKKDTIDITTERGKEISLTVGEAMSVYATSRRKQGIDHLMKGGIVRDSDGAKKAKKLKKDKVNVKGENISLTIKDIQQISSALTEEQKGFANKMVEYLSTDMAELGNERTMRIYGISKFNESNYFPIRSASNFLYTRPGVQDDARIKHMSMTKKTTPHANNPVIIGDFTEVAMNHCNDMALYYGFVLALEDFTRVYNYKTMDSEGTSQTSVKQQLERAFGSKVKSYINNLLSDINGGVKAQAGESVINKLISIAKKEAVFASLSVAVQQPSAIARTMLYLNPKYLAKTTFSKRSWNELKEYAPVAGVKDMGYFDANIERQAVDWMLDEKYEGLKEKAFALIADGNYRDDLLSFLPAYMDRITWCHIWEAVKAETKAKTDLEVGSKEFLEAAGERFTYIIDRTQVYDSVFSRSEWMRNKGAGMKTVMAFMAEPVTNLNMLYNAAVKARHGDVGFLVKAVSVYAISVAFNSALKALVTAGRDDDDDESFAEKYLAAFISGIVEDPFGMIPYLKDLMSLIKGYDSKRMDTQAIAVIVDSISAIFNEDKSDYEKVKAVASAVGMVIGLPVKNIWRDIEMIYNGVTDIVNGVKEPTTKKGITYTLLKEFDSKRFKLLDIPNTARQYVDAYFEGDQEHLDKTYGNLSEKYEGDEDKINTQIKTALGKGYRDGAYTEEQVITFLKDYFGMDEDEAYWQAQKWKNNENDDWTKYSDFIEALESGENLDEVIEEYSSHGADKSDLASAMSSYYKEEYLSSYESDPSVADEIERKMLAAYKELGYDYDENYIYWKFKEWEGGDEYEKYGEFYDAIDSGNGLNKTINIYLEHGVSKQTLAGKITSQYKEEYIRLYKTNPSAAGALRRKLIEAYAALGYNRADKAKDIDRWLK